MIERNLASTLNKIVKQGIDQEMFSIGIRFHSRILSPIASSNAYTGETFKD